MNEREMEIKDKVKSRVLGRFFLDSFHGEQIKSSAQSCFIIAMKENKISSTRYGRPPRQPTNMKIILQRKWQTVLQMLHISLLLPKLIYKC